MKNIKYLLFTVISMVAFSACVYAAPTYGVSVNGSVENGKNVTASITVKNTAAWNIKIVSSGSTYGCNNAWADATSNGNNTTKTFTTTCKASSLGTIAFTISGDITSADGTTTKVSATKTVNVVEPRPASTDNNLKSLSVDGYELSPSFDANTLEYSVEVPSTVNKIKINATKADKFSSVSGDGEKDVEEGLNRFEIVVKAESGAEKTYVVLVNVKDANPIEVSVDGKKYTLIKNSKNIEIPDGYTEDKVTIDGVEVPCFKNELTSITLIALKDESGNVKFFRYEDGKYSKYVELDSIALNLYPSTIDSIPYKGFEKTTITIDGNEVEVLKYKELDSYYLIYAMDLSTGDYHYYMYDVKNKTYQLFNEELFNALAKDNKLYIYALCGALGVILLCIIIIICVSSSRSKIIKRIKNSKLDSNKEDNISKSVKKKKED